MAWGEEVNQLRLRLLFAFELVSNRPLLPFPNIKCFAIRSLDFCKQTSCSSVCDTDLMWCGQYLNTNSSRYLFFF